MNDTWLPLVIALSGQRTSTPVNWPNRRVHRILGMAAPAPAVRPARPQAPGTQGAKPCIA